MPHGNSLKLETPKKKFGKPKTELFRDIKNGVLKKIDTTEYHKLQHDEKIQVRKNAYDTTRQESHLPQTAC